MKNKDKATPSPTIKEVPNKSPLDILNEQSEEFGFPSWYAAYNYQDLEAMNMVPQKACKAYANQQTTTLQAELSELKAEINKAKEGLMNMIAYNAVPDSACPTLNEIIDNLDRSINQNDH